MSNTKSRTKKTKRVSKQTLFVRIMCLVLALIMVAGLAYYIVVILASQASAGTVDTNNGVLNTSSLNNSEDVLVSVGLMYGDDVTTGFEVKTDNTFTAGKQKLDGDKEFEEIWKINSNIISCTSDANLSKTGMTFLIADSIYNTAIGGYHIQIDCDDLTRDEFDLLVYTSDILIAGWGFYSIPAYIYTGYALRIGDFTTWEEAAQYLEPIQQLYPEKVVSVVSPTQNAVSVVNPYTNRILFEYDCGKESVLGLKASEPDANGNTYMTTPAGNVYDGVFAFKRYISSNVDGVSLINILPLESYIAGVLPFEISNTWPIEVQKEFAIAARSFTLTHLNSKHSSYGFDLCNTTCCEVYKGQGRVNNAVMEAVGGTAGKVICYNGSIVTSYYSSTVGGVTVSAADCWGGSDVAYLQAIETPWEDYLNHSNGFWTIEVSPEDLLERLHKAGYNQLSGSIADVKIVELCKNSTYVKKLQVTDIYGTSITITYSDKVRTSLTPYVKSANFVVGRGSVDYTVQTAVDTIANGTSSSTSNTTANIITTTTPYTGQKDKSYGYVETDSLYVVTADSLDQVNYKGTLRIETSNGYNSFERDNVFVVSRETAKAYIGSEFNEIADDVGKTSDESIVTVDNETVIDEENGCEVEYKTAYASSSENFIFVGKGWGHGVGMSQWGAYDLAVAGHTYDEIIHAYFPTVTLVDYKTTNNFIGK